MWWSERNPIWGYRSNVQIWLTTIVIKLDILVLSCRRVLVELKGLSDPFSIPVWFFSFRGCVKVFDCRINLSSFVGLAVLTFCLHQLLPTWYVSSALLTCNFPRRQKLSYAPNWCDNRLSTTQPRDSQIYLFAVVLSYQVIVLFCFVLFFFFTCMNSRNNYPKKKASHPFCTKFYSNCDYIFFFIKE